MPSLSNEFPTKPREGVTPFEAFLTRERANTGIVLDLARPDGSLTGKSITIYGQDSDAFRAAKDASERRLAHLVTLRKDGVCSKVELDVERLELISSLVKAWTFDEPCTKENVISFLRRAPKMADQIDAIAADRSLLPA